MPTHAAAIPERAPHTRTIDRGILEAIGAFWRNESAQRLTATHSRRQGTQRQESRLATDLRKAATTGLLNRNLLQTQRTVLRRIQRGTNLIERTQRRKLRR